MACIATEILNARYGSLARLSIGTIRDIDWELLLQVVRITNGIFSLFLSRAQTRMGGRPFTITLSRLQARQYYPLWEELDYS